MAENRIEASKRGQSGTAAVEEIRGTNSARFAVVVGLTVVISLLCIAIVVAIWKDNKQERDYVGMILPTVTGAISGIAGFFAGQKWRKSGSD